MNNNINVKSNSHLDSESNESSSTYKRRMSLENDFMNYNIDDMLFGAMYYLATYHPEEKILYLTKNNFTKRKNEIKAICGNDKDISTQTLNRHLNKLIEDGLIQEANIMSGNKSYPSYIFPYDCKKRYQLIENEMLWYVVSTRNKQAVKIYIYLLNKYLWKKKTNETYIFTNKEIMEAIGYSTNSNNHLVSSMITNVLESFQREGVINFRIFYDEVITNDSKIVPTPRKELIFVASSKNELK